MKNQTNKLKSGTLTRSFNFTRDSIDNENRTVEVAFASEEPYQRYDWSIGPYIEILGNTADEVDLSRLNNGGAVLVDHDVTQQVGIIQKATVDKDNVSRALIRFGNSPRAQQEWQDVQDGIRTKVSVGYRVLEMSLTKKDQDIPDEYRVTNWQPFEISFVAVPADDTVGVGRSDANVAYKDVIIHNDLEEKTEETREMLPTKLLNETAVESTAGSEATTATATRTSEAPNIEVIRSEAQNKAKADAAEIMAVAKRHDMLDWGIEAVAQGMTPEQFKAAAFDKMGNPKFVKTEENASNIGLSETEIQGFSFCRAIEGLIKQRNGESNPWKEAGFEREASNAVATKMKKEPQGIFIPHDVTSRALKGVNVDNVRALATSSSSIGGALVATDLLASSFIDLLRNMPMVMALGARTLAGLEGNIAIPRQSGASQTYWVAEATAPTESDQGFDQVTMTPKILGAFTDMSRKLITQSSVDIEALVRMDLALQMVIGIDAAALYGTGPSYNQPTGLANISGIGAVVGGTNGADPTWANIIALETSIASNNALLGSLGYLTNPKIRGFLKTQPKVSGFPVFVWDNTDTPLNGYKAAVTNQVSSTNTKGSSTTCSDIFFGNWSDLLIGYWGGLDILLDPYTNSASGSIRIRALQEADVAVRHPFSFSRMADALSV